MAMQDKASGNATAALVCGILGLVCGCFPTAIAAWVVGSKEVKAIDAGQSSQAGRSMAQIGMILGIIGTILGIIGIIWYALVGAAMIASMQSAGSIPTQ